MGWIKHSIAIIVFVVLLAWYSVPQPGAVLLAGGGVIPTDVVTWIKNKVPNGKYLVVTCNPDYGDRWIEMFGSVCFLLPEELSESKLYGTSVLIIDGGDQWEYFQRLNGKLIQKAHENGVLILGTSAGAMILGQHCFTAEHGTITSEEALRGEGVCISSGFVNIPCLRGIIIDSHFQQRNRQERLKVFVKKSGAICGLGIDEETVLCLENRKIRIFGKGSVNLFQDDSLCDLKDYPNKDLFGKS